MWICEQMSRENPNFIAKARIIQTDGIIYGIIFGTKRKITPVDNLNLSVGDMVLTLTAGDETFAVGKVKNYGY